MIKPKNKIKTFEHKIFINQIIEYFIFEKKRKTNIVNTDVADNNISIKTLKIVVKAIFNFKNNKKLKYLFSSISCLIRK